MEAIKAHYDTLMTEMEEKYQEKYNFLQKRYKVMERTLKDYMKKI